MTTTTSSGVLCADWTRIQRLDPVGTAGSYAGYLLIEWPLPWPRDAGEIAELGEVRQLAFGLGLRLQLLVPQGGERRRVALYQRPDGPFTGFSGRALEVALPGEFANADGGTAVDGVGDVLNTAAQQLVAGGGDAIDSHEVLVCTHGSRDRCCGSRGTELWRQLDSGPRVGDARLWRTSHTGGHRFAATGVVLPDGTLWGFLDSESLRKIVTRTGPIEDVLPRYRGCSGLGTPAAQALERAVLGELGWQLFECGRQTEDLGDGRLRLTLTGPVDTAWEGRVVPGRTIPVPDCGQQPDLATKSEAEQLVIDLVQAT